MYNNSHNSNNKASRKDLTDKSTTNANSNFNVNNNSKLNLQMLCLVSIVAIVGLVVVNRK